MGEKPILVIGSSGQVARSLAVKAVEEKLPMVRVGRPAFDIADLADIERTVAAIQPQAIVNAAAYTAVDMAEDEPDLAYRINCDAAAWVAATARLHGVPLVHISTDYVFDGRKKGRYLESDWPNPLNFYGRSKLEGEKQVLKFYPEALVIRTSWVYGSFGENFFTKLLRKAETESILSIVNDQYGAPTFACDLAAGILQVVSQLEPRRRCQAGGVYHLTNDGETTWYDFAEEILDQLKREKYSAPALRSIKTQDYPTKAQRPRNSCLDTSKIEREFGVRLRPWRSALVSCCEEAINQRSFQPC